MKANVGDPSHSIDDEIAGAIQRLRRSGHDAFQRDLALVRQLAQSLEALNIELMHEIDSVLESYTTTRAQLLKKLTIAADKAEREKEKCLRGGSASVEDGVDIFERLRTLNGRSRSA